MSPTLAPDDARVFITGGAGFIGWHIAKRFRSAAQVTIFDTFTRGEPQDLAEMGPRNLRVVKGDVVDRDLLIKEMAGHDLVFHCAAHLGVTSVQASPLQTLDVNIRGSAAVIDAASSLKDLRRIVCFSTSEVYGIRAVQVAESEPSSIPPPGDPRWSYAAGKLAEEHYAFAHYYQDKLPVVVVRPFNIYGPGQLGEGAIANFIRKAIRGEPLEVRGGGHQVRAWCFVDDLVDGVLLASSSPNAVGHAFNIGNPWEVETTLSLATRIVAATQSDSPVRHVSGGAEVQARVPDISKAASLLGYRPAVRLDEGIPLTITWFREGLR
jgi:nucleoside-diphosphate-sugar epimerase